MGFPDYDQFAKWLQLLGQNIAFAMVAAIVQAAVGPLIDGKKYGIPQITVGVLFGLSAILSATYPIQFVPGVLFDMRNVFVLVAGLSGGPIGALTAAGLAIAYRIYLGGVGAPIGVGGVGMATLLGALVYWRYGSRVREFGVVQLAALGLGAGVILHFWGQALFTIFGVPLPPTEATFAILLLYPVATAFLGMASNMVHYNVWRRTQRQLTDIMETTSDLIWETDADRRISYLSDRYLTIIGYRPSELVGRPVSEVGGRWLDDASRQIAEAAIAAQKPYSGLYFLPPTKNGTRVILISSARPRFDSRGRFAGYRGTATDVSDREQALAELREREEELRLSRDHLARAQEVAQVASTEVNLSTQMGYWSDHAYRLFGLDQATTTPGAEPFLTAVHPDDRERMRNITAAARRGEETAPTEFRVVHRNGDVRWLHRVAEIIRDADGKPMKVTSTVHDITDRKRSEEELRISRGHLALAQKVGLFGSAEMDLRTGRTVWSDTWYAILGLDPATATPDLETYLACVHPEDREAARHRGTRSAAKERNEPTEYRIVRPDGEIRWIYTRTTLIDGKDGLPETAIATLLDITDRKQAEIELHERENRLQLSAQHLGSAQRVGKMGSVEVDAKTGKTVWSTEQYDLLGFDPSAGQPSADQYYSIVHPDDRERLRGLRARELAEGKTESIEYRLLKPGSEMRWVHRQAELALDADGHPYKWIVVHQDVTARKQMEEALRYSQEHLAAAQQIAHLGSIELDYGTGTIYWSDEVYRILGLDPANTAPGVEQFRAVVHPDDRHIFDVAREQVVRGEDVNPGEFRIIRPDGETRWIYRQIRVLGGEQGKPRRSIAALQDVTERKRSEAELLHREAQLRLSREHLTLAQRLGKIGSAEVDLVTGEIYWSEEVFKIIGRDSKTTPASAETFFSVIHPDDREKANRRIQNSSQGLPNEPIEYRLVRPNGETGWLYLTSEPIFDKDGKATKILFTCQDITDLKRSQFERSELERQLMQAQKMEAVGNLTGGIAHDFNNLLSVVLGRLEMAEAELSDRPEVREWIRICLKAAHRGAALTRSMLAFSRQQPLKPEEIDVPAAIADLIVLLPRALGETIGVSVTHKPDLWRCDADSSQLQSALLNLALNARDAMPNGGQITIAAENAHLDEHYAEKNPDVAPGDYVVLSVSDSGCGMPADVLAHAFEPFFTTKEVGRGSGLGLSMVYGFAKQSGGYVKIESRVGIGTTVALYLPRSSGALARANISVSVPATMVKSGMVLVVEDDDDMRALASTQLDRLGYQVHTAATGRDALAIVEQQPKIMLLLTDLTLPGDLNGRDLAREMLARLPHLRVIYMSGYSEEMTRHQNHLDASIRLLQKPYSVHELRSAIDAALH